MKPWLQHKAIFLGSKQDALGTHLGPNSYVKKALLVAMERIKAQPDYVYDYTNFNASSCSAHPIVIHTASYTNPAFVYLSSIEWLYKTETQKGFRLNLVMTYITPRL